MPDPINDVRVLVQMISGQADFDPWKASTAVLDLAATAFSIFVPKSAEQPATLPANFSTDPQARQKFTLLAVSSLLPIDEQRAYHWCPEEPEYTPKFFFPTELIVRVALGWVLEKTLQCLVETLKKHSEDKPASPPVSGLPPPVVLPGTDPFKISFSEPPKS